MNNFKLNFDEQEQKTIFNTYCKGCTEDEFKIFIHLCQTSGLDPRSRQIWSVSRYDAQKSRNVFQTLVSIDGFRLIAERTGRYAPGQESKYTYDDKGRIICATAYVKKMTADGTWHEVACSAFFSEYAALKKDGNPTKFWADKPHIMLSKCAEALALRRAFPQELSGLYTDDEMDMALQIKKDEQNQKSEEKPKKSKKEDKLITSPEEKTEVFYNAEQSKEIQDYFASSELHKRDDWTKYIEHVAKTKNLDMYGAICLMRNNDQTVRDSFEKWVVKNKDALNVAA